MIGALLFVLACAGPAGVRGTEDTWGTSGATCTPEVCNDGVDDDCDGLADEDDPDVTGMVEGWADGDGDGFGVVSVRVCAFGSGVATYEGDCNDGDAGVHPRAEELCDGIDHDCDGCVDEGCVDEVHAWADASYPGEEGDYAGYSVSGAGDFNGDGLAEMIIGVPQFLNSQHGGARLVIGSVSPGDVGLECAGPRFTGLEAGSGRAVSNVGDVNGDGFDDVLLGSPYNNRPEGSYTEGAAYLVLGRAVPRDVDLNAPDALYRGATLIDHAGSSLASAGDVDDDGFGDMLIGAPGNGYARGVVYLVRGGNSPGDLNLAAADAAYRGEAMGTSAGCSVSTVGDMDGDGIVELGVGAAVPTDGPAAYLVLGARLLDDVDLASADARYVGAGADHYGGCSVVAGAGDVNGDGHGDLLIGTPGQDANATIPPGVASLILGGGPIAGDVDLVAADARYTGQSLGDRAGASVAGVEDVDGDGFGDVLIGAPGPYPDTGTAWLVSGSASPASLELALDATRYSGAAAGDEAGSSVAAAGDVDGDGSGDLVVGAWGYDRGGTESGIVWLILGGGR